MTAIPLGVSNYIRSLGKTPPIIVRNMYLEKDPANLVDGTVHLQRPGLSLFDTLDNGPINCVFQQPGTFNGDYLVVAGDKLYRETSAAVATLLGSLGTSARCIIAASTTRAIVATGAVPYSTDGTTLVAVNMPDGENVSSVAFINGYFLLTVTDSQHIFYIPPGGTDPDALSFFSAENSPDNLARVVALFDELWAFGSGNSVEVFQPTGVLDLPFERIAGRLYNVGCANKDAVAIVDNTIFWPATDGKVYRAGQNSPERVSDHALEESLQDVDASTLSAWAFSHAGHSFYVLRIGASSQVYDIENANWIPWDTYLHDTWRAWAGTDGNGAPVLCGDDENGNLYRLVPGQSDDNGVLMVREIVGGVQVLGQPVRCDNVEVFVSTGWEEDVDDEPFMEVNWSDDSGMTYPGPWMDMSLGLQGAYAYRTYARQLGLVERPGRVFRFRMSDDTNWRVSFARMNEM